MTAKDNEPQIRRLLPPEVMADIGTVLASGLPDDAVARNLEAVLHQQKDRLAKQGYSPGMLTEELLKKRRPSR